MASFQTRLLLLLLWLDCTGNWGAIGLHPCDQSSCYPPPGNLLIGRESQLHATSTCGLERQESYCTRENGRKKCFWCDSRPINTNYPQFSHKIHNVVSQSSPKPPNERRTWWQAEGGREDVSIQVDLEDTFDFISLRIKFKSLPPAALLIERSYDFGSTWQIYKYFARNCDESFPEVPSHPPRYFSDVTCESLSPTLEREILFRVPTVPLTIKNAFSEALNIRKITNLRLKFTKLETLGDNLEKRGVKRLYYYAVSELVVQGTCSCSGHAAQCLSQAETRSGAALGGRCMCSHHTQGNNCQRCEDLYNDIPWQPALGKSSNPCKKCDCNNHAIRCHFDAAAYIISGNVSGGICDSCQHNTMGRHCEQCKAHFYQDMTLSIDDPEVCQPCGCDPRGSVSDLCASAGGRCNCREHAEGRRCDRCQDGYTWRMQEGHIHGCQECLCNNHTSSCQLDEAADGVICDSCQHNTRGKECELCKIGFYKDPERSLDDPKVCKECNCNNHTSLCHFDDASDISGEVCDSCQHNTMGKNCELCITGFYKDPERSSADPEMCQQCNCNNHTSSCHLDDDASDSEVVCEFCQHNTMGKECESCKPGFYQDPTRSLVDPEVCQECNCNNHASSCFYDADVSGAVCEFCQHNTIGNSCEMCKSGFYMDPIRSLADAERCQECNCNNHTSSCLFDDAAGGVVCDSCQHNTMGKECKLCSTGFYKDSKRSSADPEVCQKCNCNSHASSCYSEADINGEVCDSCQHNTMGANCELCKPGFYKDPIRSLADPEVCQECNCNNHTSSCRFDNVTDTLGVVCDSCLHNTTGRNCELCKPGFYRDPRRSLADPEACQECNCNNHTSSCYFSEAADLIGEVCESCQHNTMGNNCQVCKPGFYKDPLLSLADPEVCRVCKCNNHAFSCSGHAMSDTLFDNKVTEAVCDSCQHNTTGNSCEFCKPHFYQDPERSIDDPDVCLPCDCDRRGCLEDDSTCDSHSDKAGGSQAGRCHCRENVEGFLCDQCRPGFWDLNKQHPGGCQECSCHPDGSLDLPCDPLSGECVCRPRIGGERCDECQAGSWGFPKCLPCQCNGNAHTCDAATGTCEECRNNTAGDHCETCLEGYFKGESSCEPCRCPDTLQSGHSFASRCSLDAEGAIVCECQEGYTGAQCNVCANGYYGNPDNSNGSCLPCNCNRNVNPWQPKSCDSLTGKCINCLFNTEGANCENCITGFFGDALNQRCQECDCDPLGTNHTAGACDRVSGQCPCLPHVVTLSCSECSAGFWRLASGQGCEPCGCQPTGSNTEQCNQFDGLCDCKPGYIGYKCDKVDKFVPT